MATFWKSLAWAAAGGFLAGITSFHFTGSWKPTISAGIVGAVTAVAALFQQKPGAPTSGK